MDFARSVSRSISPCNAVVTLWLPSERGRRRLSDRTLFALSGRSFPEERGSRYTRGIYTVPYVFLGIFNALVISCQKPE